MTKQSPPPISSENIENLILQIRGQKVILDQDLARLYGVTTKRLNEQVKRNSERFPVDFMFQLTKKEFEGLKSQNATSSWGGRRKLPFAFTEHGALMAANVLKTPQAIHTSVRVVRSFVRLRQILATHAELAKRLGELEDKCDERFKVVFDAIRKLMMPEKQPSKRKIGFRLD